MTDIRQSEEYAQFMQKIGWGVDQYQISYIKYQIFIKNFPLVGSFVKILRVASVDFQDLKKYKAFKIFIQPTKELNLNGFKPAKNSYSPTKTIVIDLKKDEDEIFNSFTPEKRRAIRRAIKNKIIINKSDNIEGFIKLKNRQLWPFGFLLRNEIKNIWSVFKTAHKAELLMADAFAGVLLLFHEKTAYYWLASSTKEANGLFAPSLLVWEAIKLSKKRGCTEFDFEGIEDERFKGTKSWRGFTKFKRGFGGKEFTYPMPLVSRKLTREENIAERIVKYVKDNIIDIGCGKGNITKILRGQRKKVTAVDVGSFKYKSNIPDVIIYDGNKLPFENNQFDTSLLLAVLHHAPDPLLVLSEAVRVSGNLVVMETTYQNIFQKIYTVLTDSLANLQFNIYWNSYKNSREWERIFKFQKLKILDKKYYIDYVLGVPFLHVYYFLENPLQQKIS